MLLAISITALLIAGFGITLMFEEVFIPSPMLVLIVMGVMTSIFYTLKYIRNKNEANKASRRIVIISNTLYIVMILSAFAYEHWKWETIVSHTAMMKLTLVLVGGLSLYANIMYIRAELVYKEKRGNQRIKDKPEESIKEVKAIAKQARSGEGEIAAVLGESREHEGYPVVMKENDFFVHSLFVGSTGSGKTASVLEPLAYQLLLQKKKGKKLGVTVVEPKRDFALEVKTYCDEMDIPYIFIDPLSEDTNTFNPMEGEVNQVAEATVVVLQGLFGKQDQFFATVQELSARKVTQLLKELQGDDLDIINVMNTLRDPDELEKRVNELEARDGMTDLVQFFKSELLGNSSEKYRQFVIGLRSQLENITSNDLLKRIMTGKSDLDINKHFEEGGVLIVNTELGALGKSGNIFGQFLIMHLQNGTFNRPGPPKERIPHFMIVDEYSLYINPEIERFLSVARSYKVAGIFATQSLGQLEVESGKNSGKAMRQAIMTNCRNQLVFGGVSSEDAYQFAEEFGKDKVVMRQATYKHRIFLPVLFPDSYRDTETEEYRFDPTDIMTELKKYTFIHKLMYDNQIQRPEIAKGVLVPRNWKTLKEWEDKSFITKLIKIWAGTDRAIKSVLLYWQERKQEKGTPATVHVTNTANIDVHADNEVNDKYINDTNSTEYVQEQQQENELQESLEQASEVETENTLDDRAANISSVDVDTQDEQTESILKTLDLESNPTTDEIKPILNTATKHIDPATVSLDSNKMHFEEQSESSDTFSDNKTEDNHTTAKSFTDVPAPNSTNRKVKVKKNIKRKHQPETTFEDGFW